MMEKRRIVKDDGRYLIFYSFGDGSRDKGGEPAGKGVPLAGDVPAADGGRGSYPGKELGAEGKALRKAGKGCKCGDCSCKGGEEHV